MAPTPQVEALLKGLDRSVLYGETHGYQVRPRLCGVLRTTYVLCGGRGGHEATVQYGKR